MGAFMDHVESVVAPVLLHRKIPGVAIAAVNLYRQGIGLQAPLTGPAFGDWRQHLQQQARLVGYRRRTGVLLVDQAGAVQLESQRALAIRLLCQQHALHVSMFNDADLGLRSVLALGANRPALRPVFGVIERRVVPRHAQHHRCRAHTDAGLVHHVEHAAQAFMRLAHQIADGTCRTVDRVLALAKVQQRVGGAAPAQLVVQACQRHIVAHAGQLPVGAHQLLGHDEQRNPPGAGNQLAVRARDLGQHQVDDVLGQLVLARGNPHLVALEPVTRTQRIGIRSGTVRHRTGDDVTE